jgi:hypothetical protein
LTREKSRVVNGKEKSNSHFFEIGTCPRCKRENVPLNEHHVYKSAVFGWNEDYSEKSVLCLDCHNDIEFINRVWENMVLRGFAPFYRKIFNAFMAGNINGLEIKPGEKIDEQALIRALVPIVFGVFVKITQKLNHQLEKRLRTFIRPNNKNGNNGR